MIGADTAGHAVHIFASNLRDGSDPHEAMTAVLRWAHGLTAPHYKPRSIPQAQEIVAAVAKRMEVNVDRIREGNGKRGFSEVSDARAVAAFLIRRELGYSYPRIARELRMKNHTSIIAAVKVVAERPDLQAIADEITTERAGGK